MLVRYPLFMDQKTLQHITEELQKEKERLEREIASLGRRSDSGNEAEVYFPQLGNKDDENAAEVALFSDNLSLEETIVRQLRDVNDTLGRIANGSYGICKYCKKPIDPNRLKARPVSSSCVHCKEQLSKRG